MNGVPQLILKLRLVLASGLSYDRSDMAVID